MLTTEGARLHLSQFRGGGQPFYRGAYGATDHFYWVIHMIPVLARIAYRANPGRMSLYTRIGESWAFVLHLEPKRRIIELERYGAAPRSLIKRSRESEILALLLGRHSPQLGARESARYPEGRLTPLVGHGSYSRGIALWARTGLGVRTGPWCGMGNIAIHWYMRLGFPRPLPTLRPKGALSK